MRLVIIGCVVMQAGCWWNDEDCCAVPPDAAVDPYVEVARVPVTVNRDLELLFVIDDSPSMLDLQTSLKNAFPSFLNVLVGFEGGLPNVHLGVVTSDVGTQGSQDTAPGPGIGSGPGSCSGIGKSGNLITNGTTLVSGNFISDTKNTDGTRTVNYTGTMAGAFSAMGSVGAAGCGFEQHLEAAKRALNNNPANAGFLRPNANLAVIILADEDDCSFAHSTLLGNDANSLGPLQSFRCTRFGVTCDQGGMTTDAMNTIGPKTSCHSNESSAFLASVGSYAAFFKGLKTDPNMVMVASMIGPASPFEVELRTPPGGGTAIPALTHACNYTGSTVMGVADPAVRLVQLTNSFPRNSLASVCGDLSAAMSAIGTQVRGLLGDACLSRALAMPVDCKVTEQRGATMTAIPACPATPTCYSFVADMQNCSIPPHLKVAVTRQQAPPPDTVVSVRCRI